LKQDISLLFQIDCNHGQHKCTHRCQRKTDLSYKDDRIGRISLERIWKHENEDSEQHSPHKVARTAIIRGISMLSANIF